MPDTIKYWIEAMRLRTLPVSAAGVMAASAMAIKAGCFSWLQTALCLLFALVAQIASNFANEYFDFRNGIDRPGREGPRRGVTEGEITPDAMLRATMIAMVTACAIGLPLVIWGGWPMIVIGIAVMGALLAYSAGPFPLSRIGLGEVAVVIFFGLLPVMLTFYLQSGEFTAQALLTGLAIGMLGSNVLIVNNYRDRIDDMAVGKKTLSVRFGNRLMSCIYLLGGIAPPLLMLGQWSSIRLWYLWLTPFLLLHIANWRALCRNTGARLNAVLGRTAITMFVYSLLFLLASAL